VKTQEGGSGFLAPASLPEERAVTKRPWNTQMSDRRITMTVVLVSQDRELYTVCRAALRQFAIDGPVMVSPGSHPPKADLTIWDISSKNEIQVAQEESAGSMDLFVVSKQGLGELQKVVPTGFGFLLKPVKQPVLASFFSAAVNRWSNPGDKGGQLSSNVKADRDELLQILFEANLRLQQCDQDRTNFLARALHDFRTPLTALQGYCGMLIRQSAGPLDPCQIELLERMQYSIGRLSKMSGAMFELTSRNHTGRKLNLVRANMDQCIQNAIDQVIPMAQAKEIGITVDLDPPDTHLYMDPGAIEQVLVNLLENACKFTRRSGSIQITGRLTSWDRSESGDGVLDRMSAYKVEVRDDGMGILPEHLESVFEEYTSYSGARDRSGGGLGLAICKMLVSEHQGTIWAESDRLGTQMSFVLPLHQEMVIGHPLSAAQPVPSVGAML
jgi:signal transduction histidine kinase